MSILSENVRKKLSSGIGKTTLKEYCLQWRNTPSLYIMGNIITHLAYDRDAYDLFEVLTDSHFRLLKTEGLGVNSLRADMQVGLDFFSKVQPDLLKFLQISNLERHVGAESDEVSLIHQQYCEEFADFLQLNEPPHQRRNIGVHRILNRIFPITLIDPMRRHPEISYNYEDVLMELIGYELGNWRCECGVIQKQARRFDYACPCGANTGNGQLYNDTPSCIDCGHSPSFVTCVSCGNRVTLDLIWRIREKTVHPSELRIPLTVTLLSKHSDGTEKKIDLIIMYLPLMLGLHERDGRIAFELPDIFWIDSNNNQDQIIALEDSLRYDRQTQLRAILESMLRRTLISYTRGRSLSAKLNKIIRERKIPESLEGLTKAFNNRLASIHNRTAKYSIRSVESNRLVDISLECKVAASPLLSHNMAFINRRLLKPGALLASYVDNYVAQIKSGDVLTSRPLGKPNPFTLGEDGIVEIGTLVQPGDPLVGIESPDDTIPHTAEERLLRAIFGERALQVRDSSLIFQGSTPGRVLSVNIRTSKQFNKSSQPTLGSHRKCEDNVALGRDELASITISLSTEQKVEVGDIIYGEGRSEVVICRIAEGEVLAKMIGITAEPDIVVAPDHPWAPAGNSISQFRTTRVGLRADIMLDRETGCRSIGPYSVQSQKPLSWSDDPDSAQELEVEDFDWLLACRATGIAFELFSFRCDCVAWRNQIHEQSAQERFRLADLDAAIIDSSKDLRDFPSESLRYLGFLLFSLGISASIGQGATLRSGWRLVAEQERLLESRGEVTKGESLNERTLKPVPDGLFCAKIFGPITDWECFCGKYKREKYQNQVCDRCGVEIAMSSVRRQRIGHISLATPIINPWYLTSLCDLLTSISNFNSNDIKAVIYGEKGLIIDGKIVLRTNTEIINRDAIEVQKKEGKSERRVYYRGEAIEKLIEGLIVQDGIGKFPRDWQHIIMRSIIVLPPDRRPVIPLDNGQFAESTLNIFYGRLINVNNRMKKLIELRAPETIIHNEGRHLQNRVDQLFDNLHNYQPLENFRKQRLPSFTDFILGFFRKRSILLDGLFHRTVDFSAKTRLVVGDTPDIDIGFFPECLLWNLLNPIICRHLIKTGVSTKKQAEEEMNARTESAYGALAYACRNTIILVAADSSHWRLIALRPEPISGLAVTIHPDLMSLLGWENLGRQAKLFALLSEEAEREGLERLLPSKLCQRAPEDIDFAKLQHEKEKSLFFIDKNRVLSDLSERALMQQPQNLSLFDYLVICMPYKSLTDKFRNYENETYSN
jgi:hypothetical protein